MSYKDELEAALNAYDEAKEQRSAATGDDKVALDAKLSELAEEVRAASARAEEERSIEEARAKSPLFTPRVYTQPRGEGDELRSAMLAGGSHNFEIRAVSGSAAKNYADKSFGDKLLAVVGDGATLIKAGADVQTTATGNPLAGITVDPVAGRQTARGNALLDTTAEGVKDLSAYLYGGIVRVDNALIDDSASDLVGHVARKAAFDPYSGIVGLLNAELLTGTGSNQPRGVLLDASVGVTAGAAAITLADINKLNARVQSATAWIMNSNTLAAVMSLNTNGLWNVDPKTNWTTIYGKPVIVDENMPNVGTGNKSVVLGDFLNGYHLRVVRGIETEVSRERYFEHHQTGIKVVMRADGVVTDSRLVQVIQHA